jgi:hypothetical protein
MNREELFEQIEKSAATLNKLAEEANDEIRNIESKLREIGVGITVRLHTPIGILGFAKSEDGWHIAYGENTTTPYLPEIKPLLRCSRQVRLEALPYLDDLLNAILNKINEDIEYQLQKE